jgi:hypothetical protein
MNPTALKAIDYRKGYEDQASLAVKALTKQWRSFEISLTSFG